VQVVNGYQIKLLTDKAQNIDDPEGSVHR
jgi:hypothetical protein